jgi:predicted nucleotidyltransferase
MATISAEEILVRLRELKPQILQRFRAKEIQLFGSSVRREQDPGSDIDILVDFEDGADLFDLTGLAIFLENEFQQKVDVVSKRALREELQESILNEAVAI